MLGEGADLRKVLLKPALPSPRGQTMQTTHRKPLCVPLISAFPPPHSTSRVWLAEPCLSVKVVWGVKPVVECQVLPWSVPRPRGASTDDLVPPPCRQVQGLPSFHRACDGTG